MPTIVLRCGLGPWQTWRRNRMRLSSIVNRGHQSHSGPSELQDLIHHFMPLGLSLLTNKMRVILQSKKLPN